MTQKDKVHGEGNYAASKQYNEATKKFAQSGKVERAAREAAPRTPSEENELRQAEEAGKRRAKEEDAELYEPTDEEIEDDDSDIDTERPKSRRP